MAGHLRVFPMATILLLILTTLIIDQAASNDVSWSICRDGWLYYNEYCYAFGNDKLKWSDAAATCLAHKAKLLEITDKSENKWIRERIKEKQMGEIWLALEFQNHMEMLTWSDPDVFNDPFKIKRLRPAIWISKEPGNEECLSLTKIHDAETRPCWNELNYVCKLSKRKNCRQGWLYYNGNCYYFPETKANFPDAVTTCGSQTAHVVEIYSAQENEWIVKNAIKKNISDFWLGTNKRLLKPKFTWIRNGNSFVYTNYKPGEPTVLAHERCLCTEKPSYKWEAVDCNLMRNFICKQDPENPDKVPN